MFQTLKGKITGICIYLVVLIILVGSISVLNIYRLSKGIDGLMIDNYQSISALNRMLEVVERQDNAVLTYINIDKQSGVDAFSENTRRFGQWFKVESDNITEAGEREKVKVIEKSYNEYTKSFLELQEVASSEGHDKALSYFSTRMRPLSEQLRHEIKALIEINEKAMFSSKRVVTQSALNSLNIILILFILASLAGLIVAIYLTNRLLKPIYELKTAIRLVKAGELNQYASITTKDEIGELANEFNSMTKRLQQYEHSTLGELMAEKIKSTVIVKNISEPLILLDKEYRIVLLNNACESFFEVQETQAVHKHFLETIRNGELFSLITGLMRDSEKENTQAIINIPKRDRSYYFNIIVTPVKDMEAAVNGFVVLFQNVTALKEMERIKADFISTISHEFKTPLTSIMMGTSLLMDENIGTINDKQKKLLETIGEDINGLTALVNNLLQLSKLESGGAVFKVEACSINSIIKESIRLFAEHSERKGIRLAFEENECLPMVNADYEKTVWVLNNLLSNALKYTDRNGRISITAEVTYGKMCVSVSDTGIGIPEAYCEKIFEKFVRIEHADNDDNGTGLGLAIVKEIIEANGGEIWCESMVGEGSSFTFTLPLSHSEVQS